MYFEGNRDRLYASEVQGKQWKGNACNAHCCTFRKRKVPGLVIQQWHITDSSRVISRAHPRDHLEWILIFCGVCFKGKIE